MMVFESAKNDCKLYVGGLGQGAKEKELQEAFSSFGAVESIWVARQPSGFAFVVFNKASDAREAVKCLDGTKMNGKRVRVEVANGESRWKKWKISPPSERKGVTVKLNDILHASLRHNDRKSIYGFKKLRSPQSNSRSSNSSFRSRSSATEVSRCASSSRYSASKSISKSKNKSISLSRSRSTISRRKSRSFNKSRSISIDKSISRSKNLSSQSRSSSYMSSSSSEHSKLCSSNSSINTQNNRKSNTLSETDSNTNIFSLRYLSNYPSRSQSPEVEFQVIDSLSTDKIKPYTSRKNSGSSTKSDISLTSKYKKIKRKKDDIKIENSLTIVTGNKSCKENFYESCFKDKILNLESIPSSSLNKTSLTYNNNNVKNISNIICTELDTHNTNHLKTSKNLNIFKTDDKKSQFNSLKVISTLEDSKETKNNDKSEQIKTTNHKFLKSTLTIIETQSNNKIPDECTSKINDDNNNRKNDETINIHKLAYIQNNLIDKIKMQKNNDELTFSKTIIDSKNSISVNFTPRKIGLNKKSLLENPKDITITDISKNLFIKSNCNDACNEKQQSCNIRNKNDVQSQITNLLATKSSSSDTTNISFSGLKLKNNQNEIEIESKELKSAQDKSHMSIYNTGNTLDKLSENNQLINFCEIESNNFHNTEINSKLCIFPSFSLAKNVTHCLKENENERRANIKNDNKLSIDSQVKGTNPVNDINFISDKKTQNLIHDTNLTNNDYKEINYLNLNKLKLNSNSKVKSNTLSEIIDEKNISKKDYEIKYCLKNRETSLRKLRIKSILSETKTVELTGELEIHNHVKKDDKRINVKNDDSSKSNSIEVIENKNTTKTSCSTLDEDYEGLKTIDKNEIFINKTDNNKNKLFDNNDLQKDITCHKIPICATEISTKNSKKISDKDNNRKDVSLLQSNKHNEAILSLSNDKVNTNSKKETKKVLASKVEMVFDKDDRSRNRKIKELKFDRCSTSIDLISKEKENRTDYDRKSMSRLSLRNRHDYRYRTHLKTLYYTRSTYLKDNWRYSRLNYSVNRRTETKSKYNSMNSKFGDSIGYKINKFSRYDNNRNSKDGHCITKPNKYHSIRDNRTNDRFFSRNKIREKVKEVDKIKKDTGNKSVRDSCEIIKKYTKKIILDNSAPHNLIKLDKESINEFSNDKNDSKHTNLKKHGDNKNRIASKTDKIRKNTNTSISNNKRITRKSVECLSDSNKDSVNKLVEITSVENHLEDAQHEGTESWTVNVKTVCNVKIDDEQNELLELSLNPETDIEYIETNNIALETKELVDCEIQTDFLMRRSIGSQCNLIN